MELNPQVEIRKISEDDYGKSDYLEIHLTYPFIFDKRLIPENFNGIKVISGCDSSSLPSLFYCKYNAYNLDLFSVEHYEKYVNENLYSIRLKLNRPDIDQKEALDAITGDFEKYKLFIEKMKREMEKDHKEHIEFFKSLMQELDLEYHKSDIYNNYKAKNWGYSLTATCLQKNVPLLAGFNWGAGKNWSEKGNAIQKEYPFKTFGSLYPELGSFKRVVPYFDKYFQQGMDCVQTNFCFFRSKEESQISQEDIERCAPIFDKLVNYLEPTILISFSNRLHEYLNKNQKIDLSKVGIKEIESKSGKTTRVFSVIKGKVIIGGKKLDYCKLPHPNYPITSDARNEAWEYCFPKFEKYL